MGRLGRPNGLEGFLGLYVDDEDLGHFEPGSEVTVAGRVYTVRGVRRGKKGPQVAFEGVTDRNGAERLRGNDVSVTRRRDLRSDEYWPTDLIGLDVTPGGGVIVDVVHGPTQDRIVVERDGSRFEVPFVHDLVPVVDMEAGLVEVVEIEGLSRD
ncbi:MAG: ribosome maturation factor RimM [Acidimicrobiia bacterium]